MAERKKIKARSSKRIKAIVVKPKPRLVEEVEPPESSAEPESNDPSELIAHYRYFVHQVVAHVIKTLGMPRTLEDEFIAAGYLGLVEAAQRYDAKRGQGFKTYAFLRVRGAVIDAMRNSSALSGQAYRYARALGAAGSIEEENHARSCIKKDKAPNDQRETLASAMTRLAHGALAFRLSLDDPGIKIAETIVDPAPTPSEKFEQIEELKTFREIVATLPGKERIIIEEYYFNDKSFNQIAQENEGLSKSWVSRLHVRALEMLRQRISAAKKS